MSLVTKLIMLLVVVLLLTFIFIDFSAMGQKRYIYSEKSSYDIGEPVGVVLINDGSFTETPIGGIVIVNVDTEEIVHRDGPKAVMTAEPPYDARNYFTWDQKDLTGYQVPEGRYRIESGGFDHTAEFIIRDYTYNIPIYLTMVVGVSVVASTVYYKYYLED